MYPVWNTKSQELPDILFSDRQSKSPISQLPHLALLSQTMHVISKLGVAVKRRGAKER